MYLKIGEDDIPVTGHEQKGVRGELFAREVHELVPRISIDRSVVFDELEQVDFGGGVVVPVAATAVLEPCYAKLAFDALLSVPRRRNDQGTKETEEKEASGNTDRLQRLKKCRFLVV